MKRYFGLLILALVCVMPARAWNCTDPLASRVDVGTTKPAGTAGDGDGQYYIGSDAANPKDYYVCEVPKPPVTPPPTAPSQTQTQNQSQSSNSASTSNSNSLSNSSSNATASAFGAGGSSKSTSTSQGGNATGGNVSGSGNSTVTNTLANKLTNSGNSQNTNTVSASSGPASATLSNSGNSANTLTSTGGQGGAIGAVTAKGGNQTQSTTSSASGNGVGANDSTYSSNTNVAASKIPVETAFAYAAQPTVNCASTFGAGGQGAAFGLSLSGTKIDKNCADLEAARKAPNKLAYCKVYIRNDYVRKAGVTLADCMIEDKQQVVTVTPTPVAAVTPPPTIIVNIPAPVPVAAPVVPALTTTVTLRDFGTCNVFTQSNVCKQELSSAIRLLLNAGNGRIVLTGPVESGKLVPYIVSKGLSASRVELKLSDDQNSTLTVQTFVQVQ